MLKHGDSDDELSEFSDWAGRHGCGGWLSSGWADVAAAVVVGWRRRGGAAAGICASYEITRDVAACLTHLPGLSFSVQMQCITMAILPNLPTPQELNADRDIWAVPTTTHVINQTLPPPLVQDWIVTYGIDLITQSSDNLFVSRQVYWDSSTSSSSQGRDIIVIIVRKLLFISL